MSRAWPAGEPGLVVLPDERRVVGRGVRDGGSPPDFALVARWIPGRDPRCPTVRVRWPDFGLPTDRRAASRAIREVHARAAVERVAVLCGHGTGRTGAVLAVLAAMSGVDPDEAVGWVRRTYRPGAVETPWQRRWVRAVARELVA